MSVHVHTEAPPPKNVILLELETTCRSLFVTAAK